MPYATPCQLPPESRLRDSLLRMDYLDSFEVPSQTLEQDLIAIYAAALGHPPKVALTASLSGRALQPDPDPPRPAPLI